ncbi:MAG: hypothetical protein QM677_02455 [Microbacterium sp.]
MNDWAIEIVVQAAGPVSDETFAAVADAFYDLDNLEDHDVSAEKSAATLTFGMSLSARDEVEGLTAAMSAVRTALHAAGGATPGWETDIETLRTVIERERHGEIALA